MKGRNVSRTEVHRYYYTKERIFEQSVDVWTPLDVPKDGKPRPLVVLVVGSAWLGHRPIIYAGTSWWNSSGPRTIARLGCVCVCIRHRGAFPVLPEPTVVLCFLISTLLMASWWWDTSTALITVGILVALVGLWVMGARGSANYDDMLQDVCDALVWVFGNKDKRLTLKTSTSSASIPVVFGGYSSGGHVAAMVLQNRNLLKSRELPPPESLCDVVLMISAVLAVRPTEKEEPDKDTPRWLTDIAINSVFGKSKAHSLPSPLDGVLPQLPHVLVGCEKEVFGLNWLNLFFCSQKFAEKLQKNKVEARYIEVKSDHWNILNSTALSEALNFELELIQNMHSNDKSAVCVVCNKRHCTERHVIPRPIAIRQT